jgi:steroid 5-alpha reductase family enzyme
VDPLFSLLALNLALVTSLMILVWIVSLFLRDVSIVDVAWGTNGALVALVSFGLTQGAVADGALPRQILVTAMTVLWGLRLSVHIGRRKIGTGEDYRYAAMRKEHGEAFPLRSLFTVFLLQAFLLWAITIPVQVAQVSSVPSALGWLDVAGALFWLAGFGTEAVADRQLARFRSEPENEGAVMDRGLWRYSRHPNYFGESLIWWGIYLVAAATPGGWITIFSPLLMIFFLLKVSGVPMLEESLARRKEGYREYQERTSAFLPLPPKED